MQNRRKYNFRKFISLRNAIIFSVIIFLVFACSGAMGAVMLKRKVAKSTVLYDEQNKNSDVIATVSIYDDEEEVAENNDTNAEEIATSNISINFLGEIMMGGEVTENLDYIYSYAFKDVYNIARASDFTYANFSTNITNLEKIEDAKSKYIVTKEVINAVRAVGIDAVSLASDHMLDFSDKMFKTTRGVFENNNIYIAGLKDTPVYFEKDGKKVAIISTNSVIIGTKTNYENSGISLYDESNLKKNIDEAKKSADTVIVDIHWGKDYEYGVTEDMAQMAHTAIDLGADMVIGTHALGVYPVIKYKDKPIIYSLGYFMSDTNYYVGKESFIFNVTIDEKSNITKLTMIPIYIKDKTQTVLYKNYDVDKMNEYLKQMNNWNLENSLDSKIVNDTIEIEF